MEETKKCPYCGEEILATDKNCKYCNESLVNSEDAVNSEFQDDLSIWGYFLKCLKKYVNFSGRARRKEYWSFALFQFLTLIFPLLFLKGELGTILLNIIVWGTFLPGLAVSIRRLHDIGKSGWWLLAGLTPFIGGIIILYWTCQHGDIGENEYGPDPIPDSAY